MQDLGDLIRHLLDPSNLATIGTLVVGFRQMFKHLQKILDARQDEQIEMIDTRMTALEESSEKDHKKMQIEILRVQILTGIDSQRLSASELAYFYDKYKSLGGNSFVEDKCKSYLAELEKGDTA